MATHGSVRGNRHRRHGSGATFSKSSGSRPASGGKHHTHKSTPDSPENDLILKGAEIIRAQLLSRQEQQREQFEEGDILRGASLLKSHLLSEYSNGLNESSGANLPENPPALHRVSRRSDNLKSCPARTGAASQLTQRRDAEDFVSYMHAASSSGQNNSSDLAANRVRDDEKGKNNELTTRKIRGGKHRQGTRRDNRRDNQRRKPEQSTAVFQKGRRLVASALEAEASQLNQIDSNVQKRLLPSKDESRLFTYRHSRSEQDLNVDRLEAVLNLVDDSQSSGENPKQFHVDELNKYGMSQKIRRPLPVQVNAGNLSSEVSDRESPPSSPDRPSTDEAFLHAMRAGILWQSLVSEHVRFPATWWNGARSPKMGDDNTCGHWTYIARHRIHCHRKLTSLVRNRRVGGRLILHLVVIDAMTQRPSLDIAIGCFHPNARGIRKTAEPNSDDDDAREVWMAMRKRVSVMRNDYSSPVSLIDPLLTQGHLWGGDGKGSPLGDRRCVSNNNVRAVFGDDPPLETAFVLETELCKKLSSGREENIVVTPALLLLQEFVFSRFG